MASIFMAALSTIDRIDTGESWHAVKIPKLSGSVSRSVPA